MNMKIKITIHEKCPHCGRRKAELVGDVVKEHSHNDCPSRPPGPPNMPRNFTSQNVNFVRGDFSVDELTKELDDIRAEHHEFRNKYYRARDAMREIEKISSVHATGSLVV